MCQRWISRSDEVCRPLTGVEVAASSLPRAFGRCNVCSAITLAKPNTYTHTYHKMRAFTVALLLVAVAACSAFAPVGSRTAAPVSKISLSMANDEVQDIATPEILPDASDAPTKNTVKNIPTGEVREVKWVDDGKDKANSCSVKRKRI